VGNAIDTKGKILDAAEELFADVGYDAVSVRDVAKRAKLLLGIISYHYRTKELMFEEVIARRAEELNSRRREALGRLVDPTLEEILHAFLHPYLDLMSTGGAGWHSYGRLIAQIGQSERWAKLSGKHFSRLGHVVIDLLMKAEPRLTRAMAVHGYVHLVSVMFGVFAASGLLDIFSDGLLHSADIAETYDSMIQFGAGGLRSLASRVNVAKESRKRTPRRVGRLRVAR
jgi:AcrR family transcriptional regulator